MPYRAVIICARGEQSFPPDQVKRLRLASDAVFHARLNPLSKEEFIRLCRDADIVAVTRRSVKELGADILGELPALKGLAIYATGYDWVDHYHLAARGVPLSYLPDWAAVSVAEHVMGLMLAMSRRVHLSHDRVRGLVPEGVSLCGWELRGKKLGIIGLGRIGQRVAKLAVAFGMEVYYYDLERKSVTGASYLPLSELLRSCDVISLSASRRYGEPPILTRENIRLIKKGACVINAGRPALADTPALIKAINDGRLVGYAVDETLEDSLLGEIRDYGRVLQTGHTAWYSREAIARGTSRWADNIIALAVDSPINVLNPEG
ncbi:MAG: D-isomer specific 2-hydroxyacid dehydrogenase family protein [Bacillota bacterium]